MLSASSIAEKATMQSFINSFMRETAIGTWIAPTEALLCVQPNVQQYVALPLEHQQITIYVASEYRSLTGRHLFAPLAYMERGRGNELLQLDYVTLISLLAKELTALCGQVSHCDELVLRAIQSCQNIKQYVKEALRQGRSLTKRDFSFIEAEQSLLFGHVTHPTPKSRQGMFDWQQCLYSPELNGAFQLHYFRAHQSLVEQRYIEGYNPTLLIKEQLKFEEAFDLSFIQQYCQDDEYALLPIHPLQAEWLLTQPHVQRWMEQGLVQHLGMRGFPMQPTASVRTLYRDHHPYMLKLSFQVKLTNSLRVNKRKELASGIEISQLLQTVLRPFSEQFPQFQFVKDPAYITLNEPSLAESGFEIIVRENPFNEEGAHGVTLIAGLVQDPIVDERSRLATIIHHIAEREQQSVEQVSLAWFSRYWERAFTPMLTLYADYGIALEAHQQNSVIALRNDYPETFYFRDNQGFYFSQSMFAQFAEHVEQLSEDNVFPDELCHERFHYYLIINHLFGLINGFGAARLIEEDVLLHYVREQLQSWRHYNERMETFVSTVLDDEKIACKANLLTRVLDIDELEVEYDQAVYAKIDNPLWQRTVVRT